MSLSSALRLPKGEFARNVLTLMTGTIIAQAIPIAVAPILTRLYSPEDFGLFALYMGLASILAVLVTGRYEQAILLPKKDEDAANLVALSLSITLFISLLVLAVIYFTSQNIAAVLQKPEIEKWLFLLPVSIFFTGVYQILNYWNNREKRYKTLASNRVLQTTSMSASHIGLGLISNIGLFLIVGELVGKAFSLISLILKSWRLDQSFVGNIKIVKQIALMKRYKKFPIFDSGAALANVSSYQVQNILFPIFYGLASSGFYFLVLRVLQAPLAIISASLTDVYKQKLTDPQTTHDDLKKYYNKMFFFLFLAGIPFLVLFAFWGREFFIVLFGGEWAIAGEYAVILAPMLFIRFVANPLSYFLYLKEKQEINILGHIVFLLCSLIAITTSETERDAVAFISLSFSLTYISYIFYSFRLSRKK